MLRLYAGIALCDAVLGPLPVSHPGIPIAFSTFCAQNAVAYMQHTYVHCFRAPSACTLNDEAVAHTGSEFKSVFSSQTRAARPLIGTALPRAM